MVPPNLVDPSRGRTRAGVLSAADVVNAALHLRRPLLVTGPAGTGKSSLARAVAHELRLGELLRWPVNSRSTVKDALYQYDAIGRLRETTLSRDAGEREPSIGTFVRLNTEEVGVVTAEHPEDPFRPQVKILFDPKGERMESEVLINTWERDSRGAFAKAVVESLDPDSIELDPLTVL